MLYFAPISLKKGHRNSTVEISELRTIFESREATADERERGKAFWFRDFGTKNIRAVKKVLWGQLRQGIRRIIIIVFNNQHHSLEHKHFVNTVFFVNAKSLIKKKSAGKSKTVSRGGGSDAQN